MNSASVSSSTTSERAARLHAYITQKHPRFSLEASLRVVADLELYLHEAIKRHNSRHCLIHFFSAAKLRAGLQKTESTRDNLRNNDPQSKNFR